MKLKTKSPGSYEPLHNQLRGYVEQNKTGAVIGLVYKDGEIKYCEKFGFKDQEAGIPIEYDDIFRIYSMTKPIVSVGLLLLHEDGRFDLDDPIAKYISEFGNMEVLTDYDPDTGEYETRPATRQITIRQLFTHTSGLSYGFVPQVPIDQIYGNKLGFEDGNRPLSVLESLHKEGELSLFVRKLSELPLAFEPGTKWWYGFNIEVLGYLIELLTNTRLDTYLRKTIFDKLEMGDTGFYVPEENWSRLPQVYTPKGDQLVPLDSSIVEDFHSQPRLLSGGGGLVSTLSDYLNFVTMLLQKGEFMGRRIISVETIDLMTTNHLPDDGSYLDMQYVPFQDPEMIEKSKGYGFGLGVLVKTGKGITPTSIGTHQWGGALNTLYWIDPAQQLSCIVLTQFCPPTSEWLGAIDRVDIEKMVYRCL